MRLMEILEEVQRLEANNLNEASKQDIRKAGNEKRSKSLKLVAKKGNIAWNKAGESIKETRNFIISAFMSGKTNDVLAALKKDDKKSSEILEIINALVVGHGGEDKFIAKAKKAGKGTFATKILDAVNA